MSGTGVSRRSKYSTFDARHITRTMLIVDVSGSIASTVLTSMLMPMAPRRSTIVSQVSKENTYDDDPVGDRLRSSTVHVHYRTGL